MPVWETVLVYVGIPLGIAGVITFGVYGRTLLHQPNRYRPGKAWNYPPAWFVPHPEAVVNPVPAHPQLEGAASTTTAMGGASGEW